MIHAIFMHLLLVILDERVWIIVFWQSRGTTPRFLRSGIARLSFFKLLHLNWTLNQLVLLIDFIDVVLGFIIQILAHN